MSKTNGAVKVAPPKHRVVKKLDLVGTAEAAALLGVERPRIGRWRDKGIMPDTVADLAAGPVWRRVDIERMIPWVTANRRGAPAPAAKPKTRRKAAPKA